MVRGMVGALVQRVIAALGLGVVAALFGCGAASSAAKNDEPVPKPPASSTPVAPSAASAARPPEVAPGGCPSGMAPAPAGTLTMELFDEIETTFSFASFCLDVTEVTVADYAACVKRGACEAKGTDTELVFGKEQGSEGCNAAIEGRATHPMNCVDWAQAGQFCRANGKRLPSEAEWEWAARGGTKARAYPWGKALPTTQLGCLERTSTCPVGDFPEGRGFFGHEDLAGNVMEWTSSPFDPEEDSSHGERAVRGGSWATMDAEQLRTKAVDRAEPSTRIAMLGFRCAL